MAPEQKNESTLATVDAPKKAKSHKKATPAKEYATVDQVSALTEMIGKVVEKIGDMQAAIAKGPKTPEEVKEEKAIESAAAQDIIPLNPKYLAQAKETIGEAVDHVEIATPDDGGVIYTVIIKQSHSNAPKDYLERNHGQDRRSKQIANEGLKGAENWNRLIAANLKRGKNINNK